MIRLGLTVNGRPTVILGLTPENLRRMAEGQPAQVNLRDLDPDGPPTPLPDVDVLICDTTTEDWRRGLARLGIDPGVGRD